MSNTDSFIEEVTEEVRRDRLYGYLKRYGWIAVLGVVLIVGGAAYREYSQAQERATAQAFGDSIVAALQVEDAADRLTALQDISAADPRQKALLDMLIAADQAGLDDEGAAAETLREVARDGEIPQIYRQIASFKALTKGASVLPIEQRLVELQALAVPGNPMRLLAEEQLALIDIEQGNPDAALDKLQAILADAEVTAGLRRRASQLIVALGGSLSAG